MTANGRTILAFLLGAAVVLVGHALFRADDIVRARFAEPACAPAPACATARALFGGVCHAHAPPGIAPRRSLSHRH